MNYTLQKILLGLYS